MQFVGTIRYSGDTFLKGHTRIEVLIYQLLKTRKYILILYMFGCELPVVESYATVQYQFDIVYDNLEAGRIKVPQFVFYTVKKK